MKMNMFSGQFAVTVLYYDRHSSCHIQHGVLKDASRVGSGEHNTECQVVDGASKGLGTVGVQVDCVARRQVDYL